MERSSIFVSIALFAIVLGMGLVVFKQTRGPALPPPAPSAGDNALKVVDQNAGRSITIDTVTLTQNGFVVIKDEDGKVLAASPVLASGENRYVFISVTISEGRSYTAELYGDDGDNKFNVRSDALLKTASGNTVVVRFKTL